ncbi:hypothetical protein ACFYZ9_33620 [Streptomyces sp. NPDC001691]|uniref:hypothetical protein n=1 Tax=Streptomyces sp. NPDC001691 TaxID=3364600 RepID=UPI003678AECA
MPVLNLPSLGFTPEAFHASARHHLGADWTLKPAVGSPRPYAAVLCSQFGHRVVIDGIAELRIVASIALPIEQPQVTRSVLSAGPMVDDYGRAVAALIRNDLAPLHDALCPTRSLVGELVHALNGRRHTTPVWDSGTAALTWDLTGSAYALAQTYRTDTGPKLRVAFNCLTAEQATTVLSAIHPSSAGYAPAVMSNGTLHAADGVHVEDLHSVGDARYRLTLTGPSLSQQMAAIRAL